MRPSARARTLAVHVHPGGQVEVVAPLRTRPSEIEAFVAASRSWIERAREQLLDQPVVDRSLPERIRLIALDAEYSVHYGVQVGRHRWREQDGQLQFPVPRHQRAKGRALLKRWLAQSGRAHLVPWLRQTAAEIGIDFNKTQIRGQKTRWGSCSVRGTISLNYCLLFLEPVLVHYLLVHELCHRVHFNHSRRYWALVESLVPDYRQLDRRLGDAWRAVPGWALP